jgi:hypothetical protein
MDSTARKALAFATVAFFAAQLLHTILDRSSWPLCSYNMFSRVRPLTSSIPKVLLYEDRGAVRVADVWEVLPLEFFRAISLTQNVFYTGGDEATRERLAAFILEGLNRRPWGAFDQTYASARPSPGARFVGISFARWRIDLEGYQGGAPTPLDEEIVFTYGEAP